MAIRCEVCGQYPIKGALRTFFQWPADVNQRVYWRTCLGIQELNIDKPDLYICSDHFEQMQTIRKGTALRKDAFPKRYEGPLPTFPQEDEIPKEELDPPQVKNEEIGIFEEPGPSAPIFDDEEIMPEELSMAKLMHLFAAAAKERPSSIVPLVTPITAETKAFSNILIDRQEKYLDAYCKSCLRQVDVVNMLEANCEGVSVPIMYKTVFMTEIEPSEIPQLMCRACIGLLFQCYKFASMTVKSSEVLRAARERFKYLPAIDDDTIDLKNIPQKYSARSSHKDIAEDEDDKEAVKITSKTVKKRKSPVKSKEAPPEKKGRRTSTRRASVKAKKVSKKILQDSDDEDESNDDNSDNDDADPDFDSVGYEVKDESPDPSDEEDEKEEKEEEQDDNYCMLCRHQFTNMARHMEKVHRVDWESKSCERCDIPFPSAKNLYQHINSKHRVVKCDYCFMEYDEQSELKFHLKVSYCRNKAPKISKGPKEKPSARARAKITQPKTFTCGKCLKDNMTFKQMYEHLVAAHNDDGGECIFCEAILPTRLHLFAHIKFHGPRLYCSYHFKAFDTEEELQAHVQVPGHDLECGICFRTFSCVKAKILHRSKNHFRRKRRPAKKEELLCPKCPLVYQSRNGLRRHIKTYHDKTLSFLCEDCGASYTTSHGLRLHVTKAHKDSDYNKIQCEQCGFVTSSSKAYTEHRLRHYDFYCAYCLEPFDDADKLKIHEEGANHQWHNCDQCAARYRNTWSLRYHVLAHHENAADIQRLSKSVRKHKYKPTNLQTGVKKRPRPRTSRFKRLENGYFECPVCKKQYARYTSVHKHMELHSEYPKYRCNICGKEFYQNQALKIHLSVHSSARPIVCKLCGKSFKEGSSFYKHRKKVHGYIPTRKRTTDGSIRRIPIKKEGNNVTVSVSRKTSEEHSYKAARTNVNRHKDDDIIYYSESDNKKETFYARWINNRN